MHDICIVRPKMFYDCEVFLSNVRYIPKLDQSLLSISMFDDLGYYTRIECRVLQISHDDLIMAKGSKVCGLYILDGFNIIGHAS